MSSSPWIASVPWLHLHTIGIGGFVDNMFHTTSVVWCQDMHNVTQAGHLSVELLKWAGGYRMGELVTRPYDPPSTCAVMGCGTWGPKGHCSCDPSCRKFGICCEDYEDKCFSTCKQIGCGNAPHGNKCTCDAGCKERGVCCADAVKTCPNVFAKPTTAPRHQNEKVTLPIEEDTSFVPAKDPQLTNEEASILTHATCLVLGCGARSLPGRCSCHSTCEVSQDCCADFQSTCLDHNLKLRRLSR